MHDVRSALEVVGLDPQVGFLHKDRPGRPSLALDMMEEFRPFLADRLTLILILYSVAPCAGAWTREGDFEAVSTFQVPVYDGPGPELRKRRTNEHC